MVEVKDSWLVVRKDVNNMSSIDFSEDTHLYITNGCIESVNYLPDHITHIIFSGSIKHNQFTGKWPTSLVYVEIRTNYYQNYNLPNKLRFLRFSCDFNNFVDNLPINLKNLKFGSYNFDKPIDKIPYTLKSIHFVHYFNNKIHFHKFVMTLTYLIVDIFIKDVSYYYLHCCPDCSLFDGRCEINKHNHTIRKTKLVDLLLK